jgi:predicted GH43/DUF377 family glycosyl hydrolase
MPTILEYLGPGLYNEIEVADDDPRVLAQARENGQPSRGAHLLRGICPHQGPKIGETPCDACRGSVVMVDLMACNLHGSCTQEKLSKDRAVSYCQRCNDHPEAGKDAERVKRNRERAKNRRTEPPRIHNPPIITHGPVPAIAPTVEDGNTIRIDQHTLPGPSGLRFNPSLIRWQDGYLFAFRNGWAGSEIFLQRMDARFRPFGEPVKLDLFHQQQANFGREDPRLFMFRGKLHVMYTGVVGKTTFLHTSVLYARLSDDLRVEQIFYPNYPKRNLWEKNWGVFEHDGSLYAVYSIAPHRILRIDGEQAEMAYQTPTRVHWTEGEMRGGASPVLVGDEFWHFFHSRTEPGGRITYHMGVYTFDAKPPFAIRRFLSEPIASADWNTKPADQYAGVLFPGGAVLDGERWTVAVGVHDRWSELRTFDKADLENRMTVITPPRGVVFLVYDPRQPEDRSEPFASDNVEELHYSARCARRLGLPISLLLEQTANLAVDRGLFDSVIPYDATAFGVGSNAMAQKLVIFEKSPYDLTLYLDTDAFVIGPEHPLSPRLPPHDAPDPISFDWPFVRAEQFGLAMAYDKHHVGQREYGDDNEIVDGYEHITKAVREYLPGASFVPLFNAGVIFFRKDHPGLAKVVSQAWDICRTLSVDDQSALCVAAVLRNFTIFPLSGHTWNHKNHDTGGLPFWGCRILHSPFWLREQLNGAKAVGASDRPATVERIGTHRIW